MRIPALALVAAFALLAAACGGLGADELPDELSDGDREEISETLEAFFGGVDLYNPQVASGVMLIPRELGIPEVERMVWEIGALQPEGLRFEYQSLGPAAVVADDEGEPLFVRATAVTAFELREVRLVRRDGLWRISAVPDLVVPPDAGPVALTVEVHRSTPFPDRRGQVIVGEIVNSGSESAQIFSIAGIAFDEDGATVSTIAGIAPIAIVRPGESSPFRVALAPREGEKAIAETTFVVTAKLVDPRDLEFFEASKIGVLDTEYVDSGEDAGVLRGTLRNDAFERANVFAAAVALDADGRFVAVSGGAPTGVVVQAGAELEIEIPLLDLRILGLADEVAEVRLLPWGIEVRQ